MHLVVAMQAEALPLIAHYGLEEEDRRSMFPVYRSETVRLVISGVGKSMAAAATGYLHALAGSPQHMPWINAGIAGHGDLTIGKLVQACRISDRASGRNWYPPQVVNAGLERTPVMTVDHPERAYTEALAYDMEAAGFYPAACRCSTAELVQSLKVISDNPEVSVETLNPNRVEQLLGDRIREIAGFTRELQALAKIAAAMEVTPNAFEQLHKRWHFTVTQQHRLRRLLQRWSTLITDERELEASLIECRDATGILNALERHLDAYPVRFPLSKSGFSQKSSLDACKNA